jgi:hypothetical protein
MNTKESLQAQSRNNLANALPKFFTALALLVSGVLIGAMILNSIYQRENKRQIEQAKTEISNLFNKFTSEAETRLEKIAPAMLKIEDEIATAKSAEKPSDIKTGAYRAQLYKIRITLNQIDDLLKRTAADSAKVVEKYKVSVDEIFTEEQKDKITELRQLFNNLLHNFEFLEFQITMIEQMRNQYEIAEARRENKEIIEQIKNAVQEIEKMQKNQTDLVELVKMEKLSGGKTDNQLLEVVKMQNELMQTMMITDALRHSHETATVPVFNPWLDPFYTHYDPPLVIGTGSRVIGDRLGGGLTRSTAYRIYPAPYPPAPYPYPYRHSGVIHFGSSSPRRLR